MEFDSPRWKASDDIRPGLHTPPRSNATYAVSAQYAAYADNSGVFARRLSSNEDYKRLFRYEDDRPWFQPVLAFSTIGGSLLAIATGVQILIFDADTKKVKHALKGNGRMVTSIAWAASKPGILATGAVDGSLCVWDLKYPTRPVHHMRAYHGACNHVAFHPKESDLIAGCHSNCISVWSLPSARPFLVTKSKDVDIKALDWFSSDPMRIIGISATGSVSIYDVQQALATFRQVATACHEPNDEDTMFGRLEDIGYMPSSDFDLSFHVSQALLVGRNGLVVLPKMGHVLFFLTFSAEQNTATELWRLRLDALIDCFSPRVRGRAVHVVACFGAETEAYEVPSPVLDAMGWDAVSDVSRQALADDADAISFTMRPELSLYRRLPHLRERKQSILQTPAKQDQEAVKIEGVTKPPNKYQKSPTAAPQSLTSSLELPKSRGEDDEHESPMPFLSPSIPAKSTALSPITPLDDTMRLPPPRASFDSITSTAGHDSDSDDESFVEHMQGSASYLPGGVNVPLPRTCGAAFAPNGQLLTFFVTHPKGLTVERHEDSELGQHLRQNSEVVKLFPGFGNLGITSRASAIASETDSASSWEDSSYFGGRFSSRISHLHYSAPRISPVKQLASGAHAEQMVNVSVREVEVLSASHQLSSKYRVLCDEGQSIAERCHANATHAQEASLQEAADLWRLLALVVEQRTFEGYEPAVRDGLLLPTTMLSQRPILSRNPSMASSFVEQSSPDEPPQLLWLQHPLGRTWAVTKLITWAESQCDVQLLAYISALLIRVSEHLETASEQRRSRPGTSNDTFTRPSSALDDALLKRPTNGVPLLRTGTDLSETSVWDDSPVKPNSSRASSREASMPTTPYLDSARSTPPFTFTSVNQNKTRLSMSGSASPEAQRSSFGAAAKYYAQSISDKLAAYGTSPPTRKSGSPSNELSSSLPNAVGSWSKSVSFASGTDTGAYGKRSLSLAQEDDNYDSDRTIDETSLPHTPRQGNSVVVRSLNGNNFFGEAVTGLSSSLMPEDLDARCQIYRDSYSEQLRSWDLLIEAAEFDNILHPGNREQVPIRAGISAHISEDARSATCSICFCVIQAAEELCPTCLHVTHPACLAVFIDALGDGSFTCPTGCGCNCVTGGQPESEIAASDSPSDEVEADDELVRPPLKEADSLTDPRFLRARLQSGSW